ncbi:hypothetical protein AA11826_0008 [Komagataeibacter oboediens DSM 11826]|uniref:Uncharacterized protein n=1 Tax=Komagataeibacter oboediens TaxID=65958 RepID=A0A318QIM0_9PROT|nr:hypothetical protein [Komagataeibacter oboediens]PYD77774.1 hypothetical protein CFR80_17390 [Komagataeibacter oboediens]GBR27017.1 hypothetical protein AA11826_0008 [Komagataeibacter oboediens DSM 11826]
MVTLEANRVAQILKSDRRYNRLSREIAAGTAPDPGADGPAATARKIVQDAVALIERSAKKHTVRRVAEECALDRLYYRPTSAMTPQQYGAGLRFRRAWLRSARRARVTQTYDMQEIERGGDLTGQENSSYARELVSEALSVLTTAQRRDVVAVCGEDQILPSKCTKNLRNGLDALYDLWRKK